MAAVKRGISLDLLIHPGETISDLLEERSITQKELAKRAGVSEAFLSDVIRGKKDISKGLAMGLEYALDIPKSFWLNLQANYDAELLELMEQQSVTDEEIMVLSSIKEIVNYLKTKSSILDNLSEEETVIQLRKLFKVSSLSGLRTLVPTGSFRMSETVSVNSNVLGAWLCLCETQKSKQMLESTFDTQNVQRLIDDLKTIMIEDADHLQKAIKELMAQYGIDFSIAHHFQGAPVQGYVSRTGNGQYQMVLTLRQGSADIFWFSLFHEIGHIVNGDIKKSTAFISSEHSCNKNKEDKANQFAANALLDAESYNQFLQKGNYTISAIEEFAKSQMVPAFIVIGRLQNDKIIPWNRFQQYKPRYKWAEL